MTFELDEVLLSIAACAQADGGARLLSRVAQTVGAIAPFDAAEMLVELPGGIRRFPLGEEDEPLTALDLLGAVVHSAEPVRVDHLAEAAPFPETSVRMQAWGAESFLALRFGEEGSARGAIVLYRRHGWSFVGVSLRSLRPLARMAGLALAQALALTEAAGRGPGAEPASIPSSPPTDAGRNGRRRR